MASPRNDRPPSVRMAVAMCPRPRPDPARVGRGAESPRCVQMATDTTVFEERRLPPPDRCVTMNCGYTPELGGHS